jgi:hypothetical protein
MYLIKMNEFWVVPTRQWRDLKSMSYTIMDKEPGDETNKLFKIYSCPFVHRIINTSTEKWGRSVLVSKKIANVLNPFG